jgi:outer membrane protein OmpA-like peptidoglycan-associated protein
MQSSARVVVIVLQFLLAALAFAGDAPKPATNPLDVANDGGASGIEPQATPTPGPTPKATSASSSATSRRGENTPGGEFFLGYSYVRFNTKTALLPGGTTISENFDFIPGGIATLTGNVNNWLGFTADFGGYNLWDVGHVDGRLYTYLFGPKFTFSRGKWSPFVDVLAGGARLTSTLNTAFPDTRFFNHSFHQNAFAGAAGGGLDVNASKHVAIRLIQAEYLVTRFSDNHDTMQNNIRASAGLVFRFGFPAPPPPPVHHPPTATCKAEPSTVHQETTEVATIHVDASSPDGLPLTYSWSATGGSVAGTGPDVRWSPGTAGVGAYNVTVRVDDGAGGTVSCATEVHVEARPNHPPTITCSASPTTVPLGQKSQITAIASDPDNDPLTFTWQASSGHVVGTGAQVQFDSTGVQPGRYTVSGQVSDGRGGTADCKVEVDVQKPVEQAQLEQRLALHSIYFPTAQPTVKNPNGGLTPSQQQTLLTLANDFKRYLTFRPDAHLTLRGHADPRGTAEYNKALSDRRVGSTKTFLVEHGVPADAIQTEALGEERQLSEADVRQMVEQDTSITPEQRARILRNLRVITLAQNRRVDVVLSTTGETSVRAYPFNSADVLTLISPRGPTTKVPAKKRAPAKKAPAKPPAR